MITGDDTPVGPQATTSLAPSVRELATNANKHGALLSPGGSVTITTRCDGDTGALAGWSGSGQR